MKRSRNRGRRQGPVNRSYDSNGPDVRVRGTASQVYEKYQALARDAQLSGDRIHAENYLQHAEHYFRITQQNQPAPNGHEAEADAPDADGNTEAGAPPSDFGVVDAPPSDETDGYEPLVLPRTEAAADRHAGMQEDEEDLPPPPKKAAKKTARRRGPLKKKGGQASDDAADTAE